MYTPPPPQAQPEDPNKPRAQVFAIMRNGHEVKRPEACPLLLPEAKKADGPGVAQVIRGLMKDCEVAPDMSAFRRALAILMRWQVRALQNGRRR